MATDPLSEAHKALRTAEYRLGVCRAHAWADEIREVIARLDKVPKPQRWDIPREDGSMGHGWLYEDPEDG